MQFQVPQFIEVEDKIFGPLTFKQFVYIAGGAGAAYLLWRVLPLFVAAPLILAVAGFAASLAFLQFNSRPFILAIENSFFYFLKTKLYLWNNEEKTKKVEARRSTPNAATPSQVYVPKLSDSKLHELALSLDIKERIAGGVASGEERGEISTPAPGIVAPIHTAREARI